MYFNVGDIVIHNSWPDRYYGRVVKCIGAAGVRVEFFASDKHTTHEKGYSFGVGTYYTRNLSLVNTLTPQEKVLKKIKLLDQRFEERQKQKAKEKENANKVAESNTIASVQSGQYIGRSLGEIYGHSAYQGSRVTIRPTYF